MTFDKIYNGDSIEVLKQFEDNSINCCVTSPPYFGLRDYGVDGQIGQEDVPEKYIERLVKLFREVRRVLTEDGTLWVNIGDSYAGNSKPGGGDPTIGTRNLGGKEYRQKHVPAGLKCKDLIGIPWMLAFALRADGWYLRQDIIWNKPNCMPESVKDRCTKAHEYIFLLSKSQRYYFNSDAIKEPVAESTVARLKQNIEMQTGSTRVQGKKNGNMKAVGNSEGRNKRSVWTIPTASYKGAHFAVYPESLIEPCILAGCPEGGIVLDPFFGSGTTGAVAKKSGRHYIGIDLNATYCGIAERRILDIEAKYA
jgi:DNA modification methylase